MVEDIGEDFEEEGEEGEEGEEEEAEELAATLEIFAEFFKEFEDESGNKKYFEAIKRLSLEDKRSLEIDFMDLMSYDSELADQILENPDNYILYAKAAIKELVKIEDPSHAERVKEFHARFFNSAEYINLRALRAIHLGKLISIDGILTRVTIVKPLLIEGVFKCGFCAEEVYIEQERGRFTKPSKCPNPTCLKSGSFKLLQEESKYIDWQKITLQERPEELPPGQIPRSIDAILIDDIVDIARPGDRITVTGVLRAAPDFTRRGTKLATFHTYLDLLNLRTFGKEYEEFEISPEEEEQIKELARDPFIHQKITKSIAPSIYGYETIKESVALLLFGGIPKVLPDGIKIRGESNILLIGDPGVAKSQLLKYVSSTAPRALYTSGKGSTAAGLTAAVLKDSATGDFILEAGALVLADRGVACIDEFDKMEATDRVAIHEAMEQHTISIAKAGIVATLNARTSILAAANPAFGRYDPYRTPAENIKLPVTILSRFDLIFVMTDIPESAADRALAAHILKLHQTPEETAEPPINQDLLRKYISYSRKNIQPILSEEAVKRFEDYYVQIRSISETKKTPIAITARQLESLIRLSESRARMALRDVVNIEDAEASIQLVQFSLQQVGIDQETGMIDIDTIMTGKPMSIRTKMEKIMDILSDLESEYGKEVSLQKLQEEAINQGIDEKSFGRIMKQLRDEGMLYEPKTGFIGRVGG